METVKDYTVFIENPALFICTCNGHVLSVEKWDGMEAPQYFITTFAATGGRVSWKDRIKHIWHIIRKGEPYSDQIILSEWQMINLADTILAMTEKRNLGE